MNIKKTEYLFWPYLNNSFPQRSVLYTPLMCSFFSKNYLYQLPIYRRGLSLLKRGLEIGIIHGYFIVGPFTVLGSLRAADEFCSFLSSIILIFILTLSIFTYAYSFPYYSGCHNVT